MYITTTVECFGSGRMFVFSCFFFIWNYGLWEKRAFYSFSLCLSDTIPYFVGPLVFFFWFCLQQRNYNREIKLHLHIESNICWTLLVCACMSVLSTHKNAFEIAKKFYSVFFYKYAFFLALFVYAVTTFVRNWLVLQISARKFVYFFHSIVSISFPLGRTLPILGFLIHIHSFNWQTLCTNVHWNLM